MSFKAKGRNYERKLVQILKANGWKSRRIPASILDVIATKNDRIAVFEVKFTKKDKIKIDRRQIKNLFDWLNLFDYYKEKEAVIAVRFKNKEWVFRKVNNISDYKIEYLNTSDWTP
jgi:Holliday junction resolvase - archaeal type